MIDENSRKLIERAAAHLRTRGGQAQPVLAPMAMPEATAYQAPPPAMPQAPVMPPMMPQAPLPEPVAPQGFYPQSAYQPQPQAPVYQAPYQPQAYAAPQPAMVNGAAAYQDPYQQPMQQAVNGGFQPAPNWAAPQPQVYADPNAYANGYVPNGYAPNGYAPNAYAPNGYPPQGAPAGAPGFSRQVSIDRGSLARNGISVPSSQRSRVVEEFRIVKRQVVAKYMDEPDEEVANRNRVIMVTSARPREGKTFAAINLALALATEQDLKVLLIDLDTKHHAMQEMMGIPASYGLTDLLGNPEIDFSEVVLRTNLPNLTVMPAGSPNTRSPELLSSRRTRGIFNEMTQRYSDRFVIFDAPSVLGSSDPAILAGLVGQILMVVEADHTQQEELETAVGLVSACPNVSLLLNKIRTSAADQFGSYSDY